MVNNPGGLELVADERTSTQDDELRLRRALAAIKAPTGEPERFAAMLDDALGAAKRAEIAARTPANDIERSMEDALRIHVAAVDAAAMFADLEADIAEMKAGCKRMAKQAEDALCDVIHATGAPAIRIDTHEAAPKRDSKYVVIEDVKALPINVFTTPKTPEPQPSKELCKALLITGQPCPGAYLDDSPPRISIKVRAAATAMRGRR